jgi:hypothetical protein
MTIPKFHSAKNIILAIICGLGIALSTIIVLAGYLELTNPYSRALLFNLWMWLFIGISLHIAFATIGSVVLFGKRKLFGFICSTLPTVSLLLAVIFRGKRFNELDLLYSLLGAGFVSLIIITILIKYERK